VIGPTGAVRVMVATKPVDFRKGADGLAAIVREAIKDDPFCGAVYVFRAKRADRIKLIFGDEPLKLRRGDVLPLVGLVDVVIDRRVLGFRFLPCGWFRARHVRAHAA